MIALYIHWPFCISKCPYCDFNSHVRESVDHSRWQSALIAELHHYRHITPDQGLQSIFFGGGTPSLMHPETVRALIDEAKSLWDSVSELEITLEANPGTVDSDKFREFRDAGINRLSLGIQSLHDEQLQFLGRKHSAEDGRRAIEIARDTFPRYSFDLIYARPEQTLREWEAELTGALELAGDHLSLYQLTIEPGTAFHTQHNRGDFQIPQDDLAADLYTLTDDLMRAAGRPSYEVSNYAQPGQECHHNMMYWRYRDYIGIGPGAHGRVTVGGKKLATRGVRAPELWMEKVENQGYGAAEVLEIGKAQQLQEYLMMGLRLQEGISIVDVSDRFSLELKEAININFLGALVDEGYMNFDQERVSTTLKGRLCLNKVLDLLMP